MRVRGYVFRQNASKPQQNRSCFQPWNRRKCACIVRGTINRVVLIRRRYRELKFNSRVAVESCTRRAGLYRFSRERSVRLAFRTWILTPDLVETRQWRSRSSTATRRRNLASPRRTSRFTIQNEKTRNSIEFPALAIAKSVLHPSRSLIRR